MRHCSKRNKAKIWRNSYGKKFVARRALAMFSVAATAAAGALRVFGASSAEAGGAAKCVAIALACVDTHNCINNHIENGFNGFVNRKNYGEEE